jgi:hypothetical protein
MVLVFAALAVSIMALVIAVVALPPTFQMYCGRPSVRIAFTERDKGTGKQFRCEISNAPIRTNLLRLIGVRREPAVIFADFRIREVGTERVIVDTTRALLSDFVTNGGKDTLRARLEDDFPVAFVCAIHLSGYAAAFVDQRRDVKIPLSQGRYRVEVEVLCGRTLHQQDREISVGTIPGSTYWVPQ